MTDLEQELLSLLKEEQARCSFLLQLLLEQKGLVEREIVVPDSMKSIGHASWNERRLKLERRFRKQENTDEKHDATTGTYGEPDPADGREGTVGPIDGEANAS